VRTLRENIAYGPASGKYKIYIIDEVHMLSLSAFNALLKTLEEPPPHVIFLFATTEAEKIPLTILSRCQRFDFRRLTQRQITDRLKKVLDAEKISIHDAGLSLIANQADGSLRDALSLLDQVLAYFDTSSPNEYAESHVVQALGIHSTSQIRAFLSSILYKNTAAILGFIEDAFSSGIDLKNLADQCLAELRLLYLFLLSKEAPSLCAETLEIAPQHFEELGNIAARTNLLMVERMAQIFSKVSSQVGWCAQPRFAFEMAVIRMTKLDALQEIERTALEKISVTNKNQNLSVTPVFSPKNTGSIPVTTGNPVLPDIDHTEHDTVSSQIPDPPELQAPTQNRPQSHTGAQPPVDPKNAWQGFVEFVIKKRPLLGALLSHASFEITVENNSRVVSLSFPNDSFYEKQASDTRNRKEIEDNLKSHFGPGTHFILSHEGKRRHDSIEHVRTEEERRLKHEAVNHPMVLTVKEKLAAEVIEVNVEPS
jgi:DNA polymerase-3 subunit gamma/tau